MCACVCITGLVATRGSPPLTIVGVVLVGVGPRVREVDLAAGLQVGEGIHHMGDLGCREVRGLVVAVVDAPAAGSAKILPFSAAPDILREPADVPVGEINNVLALAILSLLTLPSRGHRLDGEGAERQGRERRLLDGEYHREIFNE